MMTVDDWAATLNYCGCAQRDADRWAPMWAEKVVPSAFSLGVDEMDDFTGQVIEESMWLTRLTENLSYSAGRMMVVWPSRFDSVEAAYPYAHDPQALAEKVYGGRLGNKNLGDGWRYRGRGLIMVTGLDNYAQLASIFSVDFVKDPDLLADPVTALEVSIAWWEKRVPDSVMGDIVRVSKAVNGGTTGLNERKTASQRAKERIHD